MNSTKTPTEGMQTGPPQTRVDPISQNFHGTEVVDPFRWLEDSESAETKAWVAAQNDYTRSVLDGLPGRDDIRQLLEESFSIGLIGSPVERNGRLFFVRREPNENQPRLLFRGESGIPRARFSQETSGAKDAQGLGASEDRLVVDPNLIDPNGTTALDWWHPSWDGRYVAYGLSTSGDEQSTMYIFDCDLGQPLEETIPFTRFSTVGWLPDSSGFYYTAVVKTLPDPSDISSYYHRAVYLHRLGTYHMSDEEIFPDDDDPETQPAVKISRDGEWLSVWVHKGWDRSWVYLRHIEVTEWINVTAGVEGLFVPILADGVVYLHTNFHAPRFRVLLVDANAPAYQNWREVVPERSDATLEAVVRAGDSFALSYLKNAHSVLEILPVAGQGLHGVGTEGRVTEASRAIEPRETGWVVPIADMSTVSGLSGETGSDDLYFTVESFTQPQAVLRLALARRELESWQLPPSSKPMGQLLPTGIQVRQVWYASKDGTKISMFVVGQNLDIPGPKPTYLTGYGGFNISRLPQFDRGTNTWLSLGGICALANLRGGGEYGEEWHEAGMLDRKQNVFDDFIAAAELLIGEGYSDQDHLAIAGGSNGGLLVGAALTQRPDLYKAVVCSVPLLDMLRYHHFLIAKLWIPEYGSADDAKQFPFIEAYSPYHHVSAGAEYPAVLFMTGASDSRVDPLHARKMTALLQSAAKAPDRILLRVEFEAGHGQGKPVTKLVEQLVDQLSFAAWQTGLTSSRS